MPQTLQLEIDEADLVPMREAAARAGRSLEEWAARQLKMCAPTEAARKAALARLLERTVSVPGLAGLDNEQIDAALADEAAGVRSTEGD
jgi:hypothetical protein